MLEPDPNVNRRQSIEVPRTLIASKIPTPVIFVRRQGVSEIGLCAPSELAWLVDPALAECPLDQFDGLVWLVIIVTWKDNWGNAGPDCRRA